MDARGDLRGGEIKAMTEAFWLAIIGVVITAVISPVLLHLLTSRAQSREREEDRAERRAIARELLTVGTKIDGMLDKRVAAAQDTGNLAGRNELRVEQADSKVVEVVAAAKLVADDKQIVRDDAVADAQAAADIKAIEEPKKN